LGESGSRPPNCRGSEARYRSARSGWPARHDRSGARSGVDGARKPLGKAAAALCLQEYVTSHPYPTWRGAGRVARHRVRASARAPLRLFPTPGRLGRPGLREVAAVQQGLAADVLRLPRADAPKVPVPSRPFFGRTDERQRLQAWLAAETPSVAVLIGVAGIGKTALITRLLADEPRPTFMRRVYAHDDAHGLLSSFADFLARQGRRRLKSVITRPAYDPTE